jgi:hypothetical protein
MTVWKYRDGAGLNITRWWGDDLAALSKEIANGWTPQRRARKPNSSAIGRRGERSAGLKTVRWLEPQTRAPNFGGSHAEVSPHTAEEAFSPAHP